MTSAMAHNSLDWSSITLAVFDVDGTLYRQRPVQLRMAKELMLDAIARRSVQTIRILRTFRQTREALALQQVTDFEAHLRDETARKLGLNVDTVSQTVMEWIDHRPLRYLAPARYPHLLELFHGLRRGGISIGVFSDYPAQAKLDALGLKADLLVSASETRAGHLKPNPAGLQCLMRESGTSPRQTVMIGDRIERDGLAARSAGVRPLIRSSRPMSGWQTFSRYNDPVFAHFLG